jgi:Ca2+-binding RTX toxin-like protein
VKTNIVDQDSKTTFVIDRDSESWLFEDGHSFTAAIGAAIDVLDHEDVTIIIEGHVGMTATDGSGAIESEGKGTTVVVVAGGTVNALNTGIGLNGEDSELDNRGRIEGGVYGVYSTGDSSHVSNDGFIKGGTIGVQVAGADSSLVNLRGAEIQGSIVLAAQAGETTWFTNHGKVAANVSIIGGVSDDVIHNRGQLFGLVALGDGNDHLDTRRGTLSMGGVHGEGGDDTLIVDRAGYYLVEAANEGFDTVDSTVSYTLSDNVERLVLLGKRDIDGTGNDVGNELYGNRVDNVLSGLGANDILDGGRGNDRLIGGVGNDTFVFASRYDMDTIVDFTHGEDKIDLRDWKKVDSFDAFLTRAEDHGDDLWIIAGKDMLVIKDQHMADMHANDFMF